jgi:hypothetical protein
MLQAPKTIVVEVSDKLSPTSVIAHIYKRKMQEPKIVRATTGSADRGINHF